MKRLDCQALDGEQDEIRLFTKVRNEEKRLPVFLEHYRKLGVGRFFVVDNGSTDRTVELLLEQPRVHVHAIDQPLDRHGLWIEHLLRQHGRGRWCVVADADEFLVLPSLDALDIHEFTQFLEDQNATALSALLLDMFPSSPSDVYRPDRHPLDHSSYYDSEVITTTTKRFNPYHQRWFDTIRYSGGTRQRVFGVNVNLTKFPLFRFDPPVWLANGAHAIDGAAIARERGVMMHFKFLDDFAKRTIDGADRGVYADDGGYYSAIADRLRDDAHTPIRAATSVHLGSLSDLRRDGLLQSSVDLDEHVAGSGSTGGGRSAT